MRVVIRAFREDGYHKDIAIISERQVHQSDVRTGHVNDSILSGLVGPGVSIDPKKFPEMARFEVVIEQ